MLLRKLLRELKANFGQFFSVFILSMLAMMIYVTFEGHVMSEEKARETFHKQVNLGDLWVYGEQFDEEQLNVIRELDFVSDAQLRTVVTGTAPDFDGAQTDIYLMRENTVNKAALISGEEFDPADTEGVWLTNAFADKRNIKVGDNFTMEYNGVRFTKTVKGLIEAAEYEYRQAEGDSDVYIENIAFVYMSYDAFPTREYVNHLIDTGKLTVKKIQGQSDEIDEKLKALEEKGINPEDITKDMLHTMVENMTDEQLAKMMPYTQMIIATKDKGALKHEDEIAKALDNKYSAIIDRKSVAGLARLDSELSQHKSFSYVFAVIFVGIAVLVIATSMSRMVERQRTQIGTLNALGMKYSKILFHYISFSLVTSLLGVIVGTLIGAYYGAPAMLNIFGAYYIVPGRKSEFSAIYVVLMVLIVAICVLASYFSCFGILKIHPAEALRPAAPKQGKKCIFEHLPFWNKLSFSVQYNLRDISRGKLRAFMGVVGCAVGMLLMVYGTACNGLLDEMTDIAFNRTAPAKYQVKLTKDVDVNTIDEESKKLNGELVMTDALEVSKVENATSDKKKKGTITVTEGKGLYNILDVNNKVISVPEGTVALSHKFAKELDISVGDTVYWHLYSKNEWHSAKVGIIYRSAETQGITMLRSDFEKECDDYTPAILFTDSNPDSIENESYVTSIADKDELVAAYEKSMEIVNVLVYMMIVFSGLLVVVVLYNSGSLSFHEREKELATLKVLGFQSSAIRNMMTQQNAWLSVIGIIIGAPFGKMSFNAMMNSNGDNFDYNLSVPGIAYIEAGIFVLVVSVAVSFMFAKKIKKIDMVEVLKGME